MPSFTLNELLLRARDQWVASGRATAIVTVGLLVAHLALLVPAVEEERARRGREREARRLDEAAPRVAELGAEVATAGREALAATDPALERFVAGLEDDLDRLAATVVTLRAERSASADGEAEATDATDGTDEDAAEATAAPGADPVRLVAPARQVVALPVEDPDRRYDLAHAVGREELLAALAPVVEEAIVRPRFEALARSWQQDLVSRLVTRVEAAAGRLPRLRSQLRVADEELAVLAGALGELRRAARELTPGPPEESYWWASAGDGGSLHLAPDESTALRLREPLARDQLAAALATVAERQAAVERRLAAARAAMGATASTAAGGPADAAPSPASVAAAGMVIVAPLLLAAILAGLVLWRTSRFHELGLAVALCGSEGAPGSVRTWFLAQAGVGAAPLGELDAATARRRWRRATLLWLGAALAWVAVTVGQAWTLRDDAGAGGGDGLRLAVVGVLAPALLVAVALHRLRVVAQALALVATERPAATPTTTSASPPTPLAADSAPGEAGDDELLDVQTLRR